MTDWTKNSHDAPCPACKTKTLTPGEGHSASYSSCGNCEGVFIGREELYHYVEAVTHSRSAAMEFWTLLKAAVAEDVPDGSNLRACPICSAQLERFGYGEHPLVIADRCPREHGLWLDDGDLEKVVRCARAVAAVEGHDADESDRGRTRSPRSNSDDPMVCPNCKRRFPETDSDARCNDCNVSLFRA